jgi:hypothetical protein
VCCCCCYCLCYHVLALPHSRFLLALTGTGECLPAPAAPPLASGPVVGMHTTLLLLQYCFGSSVHGCCGAAVVTIFIMQHDLLHAWHQLRMLDCKTTQSTVCTLQPRMSVQLLYLPIIDVPPCAMPFTAVIPAGGLPLLLLASTAQSSSSASASQHWQVGDHLQHMCCTALHAVANSAGPVTRQSIHCV